MAKRKKINSESVLASILAEESFWPSEPQTLADTGLPTSAFEDLTVKRLAVVGRCSGRQLAGHICLPFHIYEAVLKSLRERQVIVHAGSAPFNDYNYTLTESGRKRAATAMQSCAYVGPAPVLLEDYVLSAEAQTIRAESPRREELLDAFQDISVNEAMFESLGPAINSGAGLFLYGEPGNGKSTLARRITKCFGQQVWIPRTIIDDGQIIKLFDPSLHRAASTDDEDRLANSSFDRRWIKVDRPTVVVGGELTMDALEIRHDPVSNVSEAPLQMKSNCGCFLIDDFGRQRIEPRELLNRWIVPLEARHDFLTLSTGKKIQVPFEQLIIFSTNLEPCDLVDEAFLRRIPYKVHVSDPGPEELHELFEIYAREFGCTYRPDVVDQLIDRHYVGANRPMRRCHPRDLLNQIRNFCTYNDLPVEMRDDYFDRVVKSYFAVVINAPTPSGACMPMPTPAPPTEQPVLHKNQVSRSETMQVDPSQLPTENRPSTMAADPSELPGQDRPATMAVDPTELPAQERPATMPVDPRALPRRQRTATKAVESAPTAPQTAAAPRKRPRRQTQKSIPASELTKYGRRPAASAGAATGASENKSPDSKSPSAQGSGGQVRGNENRKRQRSIPAQQLPTAGNSGEKKAQNDIPAIESI